FIGQEEADIAFGFGLRFEGPAIFETGERSLQIPDRDLQIWAVEHDFAGEGFPHQLERHGHVGHHDFGPVGFWLALTNFQRLAERHEFRITLDVGDKIEHLRRAVGNPALAGKPRHWFSGLAPRALPAAWRNPRRRDATSGSAD